MDTETALNEALPEVLRAIRETLDRHKLTYLTPSKLQFVQQAPAQVADKPNRNDDELERNNDIGDDAEIHAEPLEGIVCRPVRDAQGNIVRDAQGRPIIECS